MAGRHRFLVALVVPGRVADEVDGLRLALGSSEIKRIAPHITIIPPVNVRGDVGPVIESLHEATASGGQIEIGLGPVRTFAPERPIVFLAVSGDLVALSTLRNRLATGPLQIPEERGPREFIPHVTLANRVDPARLPAILDVMSGYRKTTTLTKLTLFEQNLQSRDHRWHAVADVALGRPVVVGRGGRELTFRVADQLDPIASDFLRSEWRQYRETYGHGPEPDNTFGLSVWQDGRVVGVTRGQFIDKTLELDRFIVQSSERGSGVGGQMLARLERYARDFGADRVRLRAVAEGEAESFFLHYGYDQTVMLENWRGGRDFVILTRILPQRTAATG